MINIGQGTTPYLQLAISGYDLGSAEVIYLTIEQGNISLNLTGDRVIATVMNGDTTLTVHLTQEETLQFRNGRATIQVRWRNSDNEAYETEMMNINFMAALYKEVI